jgi:GTPase SAR1 family protein
MVVYGQVVVGPPGAGKTTYCNGMQQYLRALGREALVVNLDPANEAEPDDHQSDNSITGLPYDTILDACEDIINLSSVMEKLKLGPNGGLMYCLEYMEHHVESLIQLLRERIEQYETEHNLGAPPYLLFDFPGQVELYTHNTCVQHILAKIVKALDCRLVAIMLIDAHSCADASKFISSALLSTTTMLRLELPAVNVLSKVDLLTGYGESIPMPLDFFTEAHDLDRLLPYLDGLGDVQDSSIDDDTERRIMDDEEYRKARHKTRNTRFYKRYHKMHKELCEVIDDYSLLSYLPLDINDATSVGRLLARIDKCNGYVFTGRINNATKESKEPTVHDMFNFAMQTDSEWGYEHIADIKEKLDHTTDSI